MDYELYIISSLCFVALAALLLMRAGTRMRGSRRLLEIIPGPQRLPLIGNLTQPGTMPHRTLRHLSKKYGSLMYLQLGQIPTLVVSSAEFAKEILKTQDLTFCTRPPQSALRNIYYGGLDIAFTPYNDYWRQARKICTLELLTARRVQLFSSITEDEVGILKETITRYSASGPVNVSDVLLCFIDNIMCRLLFGKTFSSYGDCRRSRFHNLIHEFALLMGHFNIGEYFPSMEWINLLTGLRRRFEANFREIDRLLEEVIAMHCDNKTVLEYCMTEVLLQLQKDPSMENTLSKESIKGILMDMFIAGTDTSFVVLEWGMSEILKNPRVLNKVQCELRAVVGNKPKVEESHLPELKYLSLVIKEILRLHPPGPFLLPRESRNSCRLDGYEIPPKTRVVINVWAIGRDPSSWENPEEFLPERFETNLRDYRGQHFEFLPFGSGRRGCPGVLFATAVLELALANLLHAFEWSLPIGMSEEELDMDEVFGIVIHRKTNLLLEAVPLTFG